MPKSMTRIAYGIGTIALAALLVLPGCDTTTKPEAVEMDIYNEKVYANPFPSLEEEWEDYGNGDPYVLRYDGRYYLYVSTKDHRVGIKAWVSDDLVTWSYAGLVTEDPVSTGAYAPEVIYWNGWFYLYTSPAGKGHYVFRSESPTGPFERMSDNVGMSIDGSVFIDDDGSWLFTHAGTSGIVGVPMEGPAEFGVGQVIPGAYLGHWTEGSMIIRRNGNYYLTYTGNHVFSKGYRIHYAVSHDSPLGPYTAPVNNPLVISTQPDFYGLGHSSTVMGPDLDSYYLVYHNLTGRSQEGPPVRRMNIDRLVFNGDKMEVLGPTNYDQPVPNGPDFADRLDASTVDPAHWEAETSGVNGRIISKQSTAGFYTAEYNLTPLTARVEAIFAYADENHYAYVAIEPEHKRLSLNMMEDGNRRTLAEIELPDMDASRLHTIRVERGEERLRVYFDGLLKLNEAAAGFGPGRIGYWYENGEPKFSYTAFSNHASGTSDFDTAKPLPGSIEAVHYLSGQSRGYSVRNPSTSTEWRISDGIDIRRTEDGSYSAALKDRGDWLRYTVNVAESGTYGVDMTIRAGQQPSAIKLLVDDREAATFKTGDGDYEGDDPWVKVRLGSVQLEPGFHTIAVQLDGRSRLEWTTLDFERIEIQPFTAERLLEQAGSEDIHGAWSETADGYVGAANADTKMYGGSPLWSDYTVNTTVKLGEEPSGQAGVLFRVTNESDFPDQVHDALSGYFLAVSATKLELYRLNYDSELLHSVKVDLPRNETTAMRIEVVRGSIRIFVQDGEEAVLSYDDPRAFMQGRVGIRSVLAEQIELGDLTVESLATK
ncbi:family 43 glycosylhydrolase [Paenibacillus sp. JCM 10914]|uniref:family 43 glycosylhydrolase n=1 Tax=Paenibacillus sp. JCM 10914 TaxID=1236974 RepID=UPI001E3D575D|nr:family 43 glycosylhydrolase [Paenibacillus sp. JCM 10914]